MKKIAVLILVLLGIVVPANADEGLFRSANLQWRPDKQPSQVRVLGSAA